MSEQELRDLLLGQIYLHPKNPQAYQVVGWVQKNNSVARILTVLFMQPVSLIPLFPHFAKNTYKMKQSDIKRPTLVPIRSNYGHEVVMTLKRIPNEDGTVEYTIKEDYKTNLIHCPQSSSPFFIYHYVPTANRTLLYNGCYFLQDPSFLF